jgi:hypothetical protein
VQTNVRIQMDMFALGPIGVYYKEVFNAKDPGYAINLAPTPKWRVPEDLLYTGTSIPADARITDLGGAGEEPISPTDPSHQVGHPWLLFYRRDIFAAAKLPRPETMDDVLAAAHKLNGTDFNGDGVPDYSVCFNPDPACVTSYFTFLGILGPMLQTAPSQGVFFQPDTMEPLVQNAAMDHALRVYANLSSYNYPDLQEPCNPFSSKFAAGMYLVHWLCCSSCHEARCALAETASFAAAGHMPAVYNSTLVAFIW